MAPFPLPMCPGGMSITVPLQNDSFSLCFLDTLIAATLLVYVLVFGLFDLCIFGKLDLFLCPWLYSERYASVGTTESGSAGSGTSGPAGSGLPSAVPRGRRRRPHGRYLSEAVSPPSRPRVYHIAQCLLVVFLSTLPLVQAGVVLAVFKEPLTGYLTLYAVGVAFAWWAALGWLVCCRASPLYNNCPISNWAVVRHTDQSLFLIGFWVTAGILAGLEAADGIIKTTRGERLGSTILALSAFRLAGIVGILVLTGLPALCIAVRGLGAFDYHKMMVDDEGDSADSLRPALSQAALQSLSEQFLRLPKHADRPTKVAIAKKQRNRPKNRYCNRLPYDDARVVLSAVGKEDYINASPIFLTSALSQVGGSRAASYIATQGPLPCTIEDFWRMVYEQKSRVIVMLSELQEGAIVKCEKYWPDPNSPLYLPAWNLAVSQAGVTRILRSENSRDVSYLKRAFVLLNTETGERRDVQQFHYQSWPSEEDQPSGIGQSAAAIPAGQTTPPDFINHSVSSNLSDFLSFVQDTLAMQAGHGPDCGPLVVHCNAGTGRTGVFIFVTEAIRQIQGGMGGIRPLGLIMDMRRQRMGMIHTVEQFRFGCAVVLELLNSRHDRIRGLDSL